MLWMIDGLPGATAMRTRLILILLLIASLMLGGCLEKVERPGGGMASPAFVAHELSVQAYAAKQSAQAFEAKSAESLGSSCDATAATLVDDNAKLAAIGMCSLRAIAAAGQAGGVAGKSYEAPPTYTAPPSLIDRVVQFAPLALGAGQMVVADQNADRAAEIGLELARINAARETNIVTAATGSNERIATGGFNTIGSVANSAITELGDAATNANASSTANSQAWAQALSSLPATTSINVRGNYTQAGRDVDQSTTGRNRTQGDGNEIERNVSCVSTAGTGAPGSNSIVGSASTNGASAPASAAYNPLATGGTGGAAGNDCGN